MKQQIITGTAAILLACLLVLPAYAADGTDYSKVFFIPFTIDENNVTCGQVVLMYGHSPDLGLQSGTFRGEIAESGAKTIRSFAIWDPRVRFGDTVVKRPDGSVSGVSGILEKTDRADLTVILPFSAASGTFNLYDDTGVLVSSVDLRPAVSAFCSSNPKDPDCSRLPLPLPALIAIVLVVIAAIGILYYRKYRNKGITVDKNK